MMRKTNRLIFLTIITLFLSCNIISGQDIDSLYQAFMQSKGDMRISIANQINKIVGDTTTFTRKDNGKQITGQVTMSVLYYYNTKDNHEKVLSIGSEAIGFFEDNNFLMNLGRCYNIMAIACQKLGNMDDAIDLYTKSLAALSQTDDPSTDRGIRFIHNNIASIYYSMDEFDKAEQMYNKCIKLLDPEDPNYYTDLSIYVRNLVLVYIGQAEKLEGAEREQKLAKALENAGRGYDIVIKSNGSSYNLMIAHGRIGMVFTHTGEFKKAQRHLGEALAIAKEIDNPSAFVDIYLLYGDLYLSMENYVEAEKNFSKAISISKANGYKEQERIASEGAYKSAKHFSKDKAMEYLEQSIALKESIFNDKQQQLIRNYQIKYETQDKENEIAKQIADNQNKRTTIIILVIVLVLLAIILFFAIILEQTTKQRNEELQQIDKTKDQLFAIITHDLKTPVIAQKNMLEMLCKNFDSFNNDEIRENCQMLKNSSILLKEQVDNLSQWTSIRAGKKSNNPILFKLRPIIDQCINEVQTQIKLKSINIINNIDDSTIVFFDINNLRTILRNLLTNAVKYSHDGSSIKIETKDVGKKVELYVIDNGVGISDEKKLNLFKIASSSSIGTSGEVGTGLGLYVCMQIIKNSGSELKINSKEGEGTTAMFTLDKK